MWKTFFNALVFAAVILAATGAHAPARNQLVKIGGVAAENGEFAFSDNVITAYSDGNIRSFQGEGDKWDLVAASGKSVSYAVKTQSMKMVSDTTPLADAHEFQFCDQFDQVSRPVDAAFRAVLPKEAKVKAEENYRDGQTLVVYTVPGADHYWIDLSLIESAYGGGYSVLGSIHVSDHGFYCGMQAITREIRAVLVNEPAGSSDYSSVYLLAIAPRKVPRD